MFIYISLLTCYQHLCSLNKRKGERQAEERTLLLEAHAFEPPSVSMARLDLPSHIVRGLFFALRRAGGVRRGSIRRHGHHGQRRSVFERLGPRVRCNSARGPTSFGRIFDAAVRSLRAGLIHGREYSPIHSGRLASSRGLHLQSRTPSPRRGVDGASPATLHRVSSKHQRHLSSKRRRRPLRKLLQSPPLCPRMRPLSRCRRHRRLHASGVTSARSSRLCYTDTGTGIGYDTYRIRGYALSQKTLIQGYG